MTLIRCSKPECTASICVQGKKAEIDATNAGWKFRPPLCPDCFRGHTGNQTKRSSGMQQTLEVLAKSRRTGKAVPDNYEVWRMPDKLKECSFRKCYLCAGRTRSPYWLTELSPYDFQTNRYNVYKLIGTFCPMCATKMSIISLSKQIDGINGPLRFKPGKLASGPFMLDQHPQQRKSENDTTHVRTALA